MAWMFGIQYWILIGISSSLALINVSMVDSACSAVLNSTRPQSWRTPFFWAICDDYNEVR